MIAGHHTLSQYAIEAGKLPPELVQPLHLPDAHEDGGADFSLTLRPSRFNADGGNGSSTWCIHRFTLDFGEFLGEIEICGSGTGD
jgi:hypothetical protein